MTYTLTESDIERIAAGVLDLTHPYAEWTHAAHFAAALWLLRHPGVLRRHGGMEPIIRRYNEAAGVPNTDTRGYHATITEASLRATARHLTEAGPGTSLAPILASLLASPLGQSRWLLAYWSEPRLMSVDARRGWLEPDLAPLPWPPLSPSIALDLIERSTNDAAMKHLALLALALSAGQPEAGPVPEPLAEAITVAETRAEDGTFTLVHETVVEAPAVEVWQAISTADGWRTWAAPVARAPEPDVIETSYTPSAAPGDASTIRQQVLSRVPGRMFAFRTVKAPEGFPNFDTYRLVVSTFELEPLGQARTRVRLTCSGYPDSEAGRQLLGFFREGNRTSLEQLRQRFVSGPIDWTRQR